MELLAIVIPAIIVLAGILVFAASRRSDTERAQGHLSRETRSRDSALRRSRENPAVSCTATISDTISPAPPFARSP